MLSTLIKLLFVIKIFILSIFEWPFYTGFTVQNRPLTYPFINMSFIHVISVYEFYEVNEFYRIITLRCSLKNS